MKGIWVWGGVRERRGIGGVVGGRVGGREGGGVKGEIKARSETMLAIR